MIENDFYMRCVCVCVITSRLYRVKFISVTSFLWVRSAPTRIVRTTLCPHLAVLLTVLKYIEYAICEELCGLIVANSHYIRKTDISGLFMQIIFILILLDNSSNFVSARMWSDVTIEAKVFWYATNCDSDYKSQSNFTLKLNFSMQYSIFFSHKKL